MKAVVTKRYISQAIAILLIVLMTMTLTSISALAQQVRGERQATTTIGLENKPLQPATTTQQTEEERQATTTE